MNKTGKIFSKKFAFISITNKISWNFSDFSQSKLLFLIDQNQILNKQLLNYLCLYLSDF